MSRFRGKTKLSPGTGKKSLSPGPKLFGSSIDDKREGIPRVVMIAQAFFETYGVNTEGLFRISAEKPVLDALVAKFDDGSPVDISSYADSGHTMAGLLKRYFRDMPEPLIPFDLYEAFTHAVGDGEMEQKALRIQKIVALLSKPRLATLQALMEILVSVADNKAVTKMGADNLAVVFAPTLFRPPGESAARAMTDTPLTTCCVVLMIDFFDRVFPKDESAKKKAPTQVEALLPPVLETPPLPPLLPPLPFDGKSGKRGSVTLDNAQLGSLLAKKHNSDAEGLVALVGKAVWAQYALDGKWYRASVESVTNEGVATVVFTDYGNRQYCRADQITLNDPAGVTRSPPLPVRSPHPPANVPASVPARPPEPVQRPELQPRPPGARAQTVMTKSTPTIPVVPQIPTRPQPVPRQSDSQLSPRIAAIPQPESPRSESPRGISRSATAAPAVAARPDRDIRRIAESGNVAALPVGSSGTGSVAVRPAPMPRPHIPSSGHSSPMASLSSSASGSPLLPRGSPGGGGPVPPVRSSQPLSRVSQPLPLPRSSPTVDLPPLPIAVAVAAPANAVVEALEEAPPVLPELPAAVLDMPPRVVPELAPRSQSPRLVPVATPFEVAEEGEQSVPEEPEELPVLPPKTESVLNKMKQVASSSDLKPMAPVMVVKADANALLSSAPPPTYVEFDDD